jgi:hypothetical protein
MGSYERTGNPSNITAYFLKLRAKMLRLTDHKPTDREFLTKISEHFLLEVARETRSYRNAGNEAIHLAYQNLLALDREEDMRTEETRTMNRGPPLASNNSPNNNFSQRPPSFNPSPNNFQRSQRPNQDRSPNSGGQARGAPSYNAQNGNRQVRSIFVAEEEGELDEEEVFQVTHIAAEGSKVLVEGDTALEVVGHSPKLVATIGELKCNCLVDTGSEVSVISAELYSNLKRAGLILAELEGGNLMMQGPFGKSTR